MSMKDFNQDPEHYARFKYEGKWYAMVPEIYTSSKDDERHRCCGCAFHNPNSDPTMSHCKVGKELDEELRPRGVDCDADGYPVIFVDLAKWERHIADRVAARLA